LAPHAPAWLAWRDCRRPAAPGIAAKEKRLLSPQVTFWPDADRPARGRLLIDPADRAEAAAQADPGAIVEAVADAEGDGLGKAAARLGLPFGARDRAELARADGERVIIAERAVRSVGLESALPVLLDTPVEGRGAFRAPASLRAWGLAARLATRVVTRQELVPSLREGVDGVVVAAWRATVDEDEQAAAALSQLAAAMPPAAHAIAACEATIWSPEALVSAFCDAVADLAVRQGTDAPDRQRPRGRLLPWPARWAEGLSDAEDPSVPLREPGELIAGLERWQSAGSAGDATGVTELTLYAPDTQEGSWTLELGVRTPLGVLVPASEVWREAGEQPLSASADAPGQRGAGDSGGRPAGAAELQEGLLAGLAMCARLFPPLQGALDEAAPSRLELTLEQAWHLITDAAPVLTAAGVVVSLPDELSTERLRTRLRVGLEPEDAEWQEHGEAVPGLADDATGFRWEVAVGETVLSQDEVDELAAADAPLVRLGDRWVWVAEGDRAALEQAGSGGRMGFGEAVALGLAGSQPDRGDGGASTGVDVVADGAVADMVSRLREIEAPLAAVDVPTGFVGDLRGYQRRGLAWLARQAAHGLGGVLADEMGLGKTIQLIAHLLARGGGPHLVVCPTSVVGNWQRELARFAPGVPTTRHHGTDRPGALDGSHGVVITSYGTLRRDAELLAGIEWDVVTLDEAQHLKNPQTAGAKAARALPAAQKVAMTGTPLENRLGDLWSLMNLTNEGLLGTRPRFGERFVTPIERHRDEEAAARLRRLVSPFVLRREKDDEAVALDLPDKIERTLTCFLTPEQAELYQTAVDRVVGVSAEDAEPGAESQQPVDDGPTADSRGADDGQLPVDGMARRGRVLALLTELKQICNHPANYLGEASDAAEPSRSGKLAAARELVAEVVDSGERTVIFTQFVPTGRLLAATLSADIGGDVGFLHGGLGTDERERLVDGFQHDPDAAPVLVVSLRAGGTGLNLTAATHVIHYDRWWNPAVEDQATDRAHRIGQTRGVEVHKLVTDGTVEERVASMLEEKRGLAESVVGSGESWVTELDDAALAELVALSPDADVERGEEESAPSTGVFRSVS
jgi:hypothetical protein